MERMNSYRPSGAGVGAEAGATTGATLNWPEIAGLAPLFKLYPGSSAWAPTEGEAELSLEDALNDKRPVALVLGAEGKGLRPGVAEACEKRARIPIAPAMESLNVSAAAAVALYEARRSRA